MLSELSIENFAIIDRLLMRLDSGLTVITGETGAGKSIIIDALQAALGARASTDSIGDSAVRSTVEAIFSVGDRSSEEPLAGLLESNGIDQDDTIILRREIHASGRSTARINGRAVPVAVLAAVGALLVDIHGQSDHLSVLRRDRQLQLLDQYGDLNERRAEVARAVRSHARARRELETLVAGRREAEQRLDVVRFQVEEIESAGLRPGEDDELQTERSRLGNAEKLSAYAERAYRELQADTGSAVDHVQAALSAWQELAAVDPTMEPAHQRILASSIELDDLAQEARSYRDSVEADPARLASVEARLDVLSRLMRKYGATVGDVIEHGERARREMEEVENLDDRVEELERLVVEAELHVSSCANDLSRLRQAAAERLMSAMSVALDGLALKTAEFEVRLRRQPDIDGIRLADEERYAVDSTGADEIEFLVSFNAGESVRPIERVASGGETSRFLLALKSVLAQADHTPTLVFDEVDVGVGGRSGAVIGERLRLLAQSHQVISITHLPQIAAMSDHHITVTKAETDGHTTIAVHGLEGDQRVTEIAEMMTGVRTEIALQNAEELLHAAQPR